MKILPTHLATLMAMFMSLISIFGLVAAMDPIAAGEPKDGHQVHKEFFNWIEKDTAQWETDVTPEAIARKLNNALSIPTMPAAADLFKSVKSLLQSRDPRISLRWPEVLQALARMPDGALATQRFLNYNERVRDGFIGNTLSQKEAPLPPLLSDSKLDRAIYEPLYETGKADDSAHFFERSSRQRHCWAGYRVGDSQRTYRRVHEACNPRHW